MSHHYRRATIRLESDFEPMHVSTVLYLLLFYTKQIKESLSVYRKNQERQPWSRIGRKVAMSKMDTQRFYMNFSECVIIGNREQ